jgi:hypothetical protein
VIAAFYVEHGVFGELLSRFVDLAIAGEDEPRHDQRLRAGAAFNEPAVDEHLIGALLGHAVALVGALPALQLLPARRRWPAPIK